MKIILFSFLILITGCKPSREEISKLIHSKGSCDRIRGYELIGIYKDTFFLKDFFENPRDLNICHGWRYYGKSVLDAKIKALERISGVKLPYEYNSFDLDTSALNFYKAIFKR